MTGNYINELTGDYKGYCYIKQIKEILSNFKNEVNIIDLFPNQGKGMALRVGFDRAFSEGFDYAITIDSDGQHLWIPIASSQRNSLSVVVKF